MIRYCEICHKQTGKVSNNQKYCKECYKQYRKEYIKKFNKRYRGNHKDKIKEYQRGWAKNNPKKTKAMQKKYRLSKENRHKCYIRKKTREKYGTAKECLICLSKNSIQHHHTTTPYKKDKFIDLCSKHHSYLMKQHYLSKHSEEYEKKNKERK